MPRSSVALAADVWTQLGIAGQMIVTIEREGEGEPLMLNDTNSETAAHRISKGRFGDQFAQTSDTAETWAKAPGDGWLLIVDQ